MLADLPTRKSLKEEIHAEMLGPEIILFRNLHKLTFSELENLNCASGALEPLNNDPKPPPPKKKRKIHKRRSAHYMIGEYYSSTYYLKFLSDTVVCVPGKSDSTIRQLTRDLSLNPKSTFHSRFCIPLYKVEQIVERVLTEKIITLSHHCQLEDKLQLKCELLVLGLLAVLSGVFTQFRQIPTLTNICATEHSTFFLRFVEFLHSIRLEYIYMPRCEEEYHSVSRQYEQVGFPGCMGSVDVVHVIWANCPSGDYNQSKGKESYPSLAFECISDYDQRICGVYGPQFGSRNDKHIVKNDDNVLAVAKDWYSSVKWKYFDNDGKICKETGAYLICNNGYLQWPMLLCPFMRSEMNGPYESCYLGFCCMLCYSQHDA
jgi:hypothetical protein